MDNGHPKGNTENPYFTAGEGIFSPEINPDLENSIDKEDWERSLEISTPAGMPAPEQIANTEIANTEDAGLYSAEELPSADSQKVDEQAVRTPENPYELGQITPIGHAGLNQSTLLEGLQNDDSGTIRIEGDRMNKSGIEKIDNAIEKLDQDHQLSPFYDEIRGTDKEPGMVGTTLQNSFNREIGQDQGKAA